MRYHFAAGAVVLDAVAVDVQEDLPKLSGAMNLSGVPLPYDPNEKPPTR